MARQSDRRAALSLDFVDSLKSTGFWSAIGAVVGLIATVTGLVVFLTVDELRNFAVSVLIIGLVLLFIALVLSPRAIAVFMAGRQGRYGANIAVMTIAFFIIVILINFLLFRSPTRIDVTATRVFSLSQQTVKVLEALEKPVMANAFFVPGDTRTAFDRQQAEDLLNEFSRRSSNFTYRFVDPELNRSVAVQYDVREYPVVVFEDLETSAQQGVFNLTEQDFVTGILVATGVQQKRIYYLTGHQEAALSRDVATGETDEEGLDFALQGMQRDNYQVRALNLKQDGSVPEDAAVLIIAGPKRDLDTDEMDAVMDYLIRGGTMAFLLDPDAPGTYRHVLAERAARR
ncbi:MAG: Gldg family protein, partial [Dehalococcoidia bacterium]|nr:Gldg family protein [Dehalococcoidia bacterium]